MNRWTCWLTLPGLALALTLPFAATDAHAQSLQQRIEHVREQQQRAQQQAAQRPQTVAHRLRTVIDEVQLDGVPARQAFQWWSRETGIPLVIDWESMLIEGVEPEQPITIHLRHVPAEHVLRVLMRQTAPPEIRMIHEPTPWYMRVMTREQANREMVVRIYDVNDLVMIIPNFDQPPQLGAGRGGAGRGQGGNRGGRGGTGGGFGGGGGTRGGTGGGLFGDTGRDDGPTREEQGEALADLVRETIEPDIWAETAGGQATVRYFEGRLIVRAPNYVHRQIGRPIISLDPHPTYSNPGVRSNPTSRSDTNRATPPQRTRPTYRRTPGIGPPSRSPSGIVEKH